MRIPTIGLPGCLAALTSGLSNQPLTSHPSVKGHLDKGALHPRFPDDWPFITLPRLRLQGKQCCGFRTFSHQVGASYSSPPCPAVIDYGHSRGPGTAFPFALTLVELLCGPEKRKAVSGPMVFPEGIDW